MSEGWVTLAALAVCAGAALGGEAGGSAVAALPSVVVGVPLAAAWISRRPPLVVAAVLLLGAWRGGVERTAWEAALVEGGTVDEVVTVIEDPEPIAPGVAGVRAEIRLGDGRRLEVAAYGSPAAGLARAEVGGRIAVRGTVRPVADDRWNRGRHLVGRLSATEAEPVHPPTGLWAVAAGVRHAIERGAPSVTEDRRALYLGLVTGDDREQGAAQRARFRVAGLSHLLAVSGQNVAFVLTVLGPWVRALPHRGRLPVVVGILVVFALVTRLEPSVMRATVTAGLATWAASQGRRAEGMRALAVAVLVLVVADPFLVTMVGFQLSVSASAGILLLGPALRRRLPGPESLREPLAVTLAAQLAVAPALTVLFGPVGSVSIPANLAAGPFAGLVMMWGIGIGSVLGAVHAGAATVAVLGAPVELALWWIDTVARVAAGLPFPMVDVAFLALAAGWWWAVRLGEPTRRRVRAFLVAIAVMAQSDVLGDRSARSSLELVGGGSWFAAEDGGVLVVASAVDQRLVGGLLESGVDVGTIISVGGARRHRDLVAELAEVVDPGTILAPPGHRIRDAFAVEDATAIAVRDGTLVVAPSEGSLAVTLEVAPP